MKYAVLSILFVACTSWLSAETTLISDEFDDGTLGANTNGTGTGFTSYGQVPVTESSGMLNMDTEPSGVGTLVAQSKDSVNPFQSNSTTLTWKFGTINRDSSGQRLLVGYRIASSTSNHFLPGVQGLYVAIALHDGPGSGNTNPPAKLIATDHTGASTDLAVWTWGAGTNLSGLKVVLNTTSTGYKLSFVGATANLSSGSLEGSLSSMGVLPSNFVTAIHNQYWNTPANGGAKVDSVSVILNGPEIAVEEPLGTNLTDGSSTIAFGNVRKNTNSTTKTITIFNKGDKDLNISSVYIDGAQPGDFITSPLDLTSLNGALGASVSRSFDVTFTPLASGSRSAIVHILSDDSDESSFDINLSGTGTVPVIALKGNNTSISNGDTTPTTTDHTDFGSTPVSGGAVTRTFTISNTGTSQLLLTGTAPDYVTLTGSSAFTISSQPTTPVAATNGTTTFQVTFDPGASGEVAAVLSIDNDDENSDPYTFKIQGTGTEPPTVDSPSSGSLTPFTATLGGDITDDGSSAILERGVVYSKTSLNADPEIGGASVTKAAAAGTVTGVFTVDVSSLTEATQYSFKAYAINALGTSYTSAATFTTPGIPEIGLELPSGTNLTDGVSSISFGSEKKGQTGTGKTFTIRNNGTANLTISAINVDGANAADFDLDLTGHTSVIAPGDISAFVVTFTPASQGLRSAALHVESDDDNEASFDVALSGTGTVPEIAVSGNGIEIASGDLIPGSADDTDFGYVSLTGSGSRIFAITNTGDAELALTGTPVVEIVGTHATEFSVVATPSTPLAALTGLSTFEVEFTPTSTGVKEAILVIGSDDESEPLYQFAIQGTAVEPSVFSYSAEHYNVKQGSTSVTLTLNRTGGTNPTSIRLATMDGVHMENFRHTYEGGLAGTHYTSRNSIINFGQDEMTKTVAITLIPKTGDQPNYIFWTVLSDVASGNSISRDWAGIRIYHYVDPVVVIQTPASTATTVSSLTPYQISGYVRDYELFGINRVEVMVNGAGPFTAVLGSGTSVIPWTLNITPTESGSNTIAVKAIDGEGFESAEVSRTFTYTRRYRLGVSRSSVLGGTVAVAATPSTSMTTLTAATLVNANPKEYALLPGTAVKLTAVPKAGYVFSHWANKPVGYTEAGPVLNFVMPDADVSGLTAHFVTNPFAAPAGQGNVFYGLVRPADNADISNDSVGFITGTMTATTGAFSGKIFVGGLTQAFAANFYGNGSSLFTVGTSKLPSFAFGVDYSLTLTFSGGSIQASLTNSGVTSTGTVQRLIYSSANKLAALPAADSLLNVAVPATGPINQGFYTVALLSKQVSTAYPQGDGYHTITLTNLGTANLIGTLADGTSFTASSGLVSGNHFPVFAQLVTPGAAATNKGGSFSGVLTFDRTSADTDVSGIDMLWTRPAVTEVTGTTAAAKATQLYTAGWPNGIRVDAEGALYNKTTSIQNTLGAQPVTVGTKNASLEFTGFEITAGNIVVDAITILGNVVTKIPATNSTFTLSAAASTGSFAGTFSPGWSGTKPTYKGILLQKGDNKGGYGFFIGNQSGDLDPESGRVLLGAP